MDSHSLDAVADAVAAVAPDDFGCARLLNNKQQPMQPVESVDYQAATKQQKQNDDGGGGSKSNNIEKRIKCEGVRAGCFATLEQLWSS